MPRYRPGYSRSTVSSRTGAVSETSIVFSSSGGHSHDGLNSSLIDTTKYSVWDFPVNTVYSTTPRASRQNAHIDQFRNFITSHVADNVLGPAGVTLRDNIINANNIIAGSITTDLLATNAITSLNYAYTSGDYSDSGTSLDLSTGLIRSKNFAITADGDGKFKGQLEAAGGSLASFKISDSGLLTDGFVSETVVSTEGTGGADGGTGDGSTYTATGAIRIFNYGDIEIQSKPTSGPYNGLFTVTDLSGEYLNIQHTTDGNFDTWEPYYNFIGTLGSDGYTANEFKLVARSNTYSAGSLSNNYGSYTWVDRYQGSSSRFLHGYMQTYGSTVDFAMDNRPDYTNGTLSGFYGVYMRANTSRAEIKLNDNTFNSQTNRIWIRTDGGGSITAGGTIQAEHFYSTDDAQIGDNTEYVYIASDSNNQIQLVSNTTGGRPYISFYNYNASDVLTAKGYIGYPTARNDGGTGLNVYSYVGDLSIYGNTGIKMTSKTHFTSGNDVSLAADSGYVFIGSSSGSHLALDTNEIQAKSNGTTAATLYLNNEGGTVSINGADIKSTFYGGSGNNAGRRIFIQSSQPSGSNGDIWIKP